MELLSKEEFDRLNNSQTADEWNTICDEVKKKRGGHYPPDWYQKIIASGLAGKATLKFVKHTGC